VPTKPYHSPLCVAVHVPRSQPRVTLTAGPKGATLLVCPGSLAADAPALPPGAAGAASGAAPTTPAHPVQPASLGAHLVRGNSGSLVSRGAPGGVGPSGLGPPAASSLDLLTMMPPMPTAAPAPGAAAAGGLGTPGAGPGPSPLRPPPGGGASTLGLPGAAGRITEEEVTGSGRPTSDNLPFPAASGQGGGETGAAPCGEGGGVAGAGTPLAGGSRRFLLQPLSARGALSREKRLPFSAVGGGGPGAGGSGPPK
jgi:hypothetical protein